MVDWSNASSVAVSGVVSVFLALGILQISIMATGYIVTRVQKKQSEKVKA